MSLRCVVVGSGVVGVMVALRLAERGAGVTLVDASLPGSGTSGTTFAHVNASYAGYWDYFELRAAGVAGYRRLRAELGSAPWLVDTGFLQVERSPQKHGELGRHADRLREAGYSVARLRPDGVRRLEPELVVPSDVEEIFFYPDEGYVEVQAMLAHLLRAAAPLGVGVRRNDRVVGFQVAGDRVRGVTLESGERIAADVVVCSCGRWTDAVLALAGVEVAVMAPDTPGSTAPGLIVVSSPVVGDLRRVVCADGMNVRPCRRWAAHAVVGRPGRARAGADRREPGRSVTRAAGRARARGHRGRRPPPARPRGRRRRAGARLHPGASPRRPARRGVDPGR